MMIIHTEMWKRNYSGDRIRVPVPESIQRRDMMVLRKMWDKACREEPTFQFFGGFFSVAGRHYQVGPSSEPYKG